MKAIRPPGSLSASQAGIMDADHREGENHFRQIADSIHQFIWLSDVNFTKHYYVNPAYERIWGRTRESLYESPQSLLDGVHENDRERVREALRALSKGEYDIEFRVVRPDGAVRWVWSRGFPVLDGRGAIVRIAGITEDITERKENELELQRITESRTGLIRGFTHDIKNPLGAADGFLSLLTDGIYGDLTEKQSTSVEKARNSIRTALDLISHMLELARAESGQLEIQSLPTDLKALVAQTAEAFSAQAKAKGLSVEVEVPPNVRPVQSDPARVRQVLGNLLSNAVKYTPPGGRIGVRVSDGLRHSPANRREWILIEVVDNGPGIPADKQAAMFEEFTRLDPTAAHGVGIGLAISQRIARALGGRISVESEPGFGSTFGLWLPSEPDAT